MAEVTVPNLSYIIICMYFFYLSASNAEETKSPTNARNLPFLDMAPVIKSVADGISGSEDQDGASAIFDMLVPKSITPTATTIAAPTTTLTPIRRLSKTLNNHSKTLLNAPASAMNQMLDIGQKTGEGLNAAAKITSSLTGSDDLSPGPDDDSWFFDQGPRRDKKYFSKDCQFRIACELGKMMRPISDPLKAPIEKSKFVRDLQNKYTKAASYGILYNDCERFYCLFVSLLGGPTQFASAAAQIAGKVTNPELFEE